VANRLSSSASVGPSVGPSAARKLTVVDEICSGPLIPATELAAGDAIRVPAEWRKSLKVSAGLFDGAEPSE
jgi:hypothetical protein